MRFADFNINKCCDIDATVTEKWLQISLADILPLLSVHDISNRYGLARAFNLHYKDNMQSSFRIYRLQDKKM